jgi:hypothetical protein
MPSRRTVLLGGGLAVGGLGWLGVEHAFVTGEVRRKYIDVSWETNGRERHGRVLWSALEPSGEIDVEYAPSYAEDAVQSPGRIAVDESVDGRLNDAFRDVTYRLGVTGTASDSGYGMKRVSRDGFNRPQLGERATVARLGDQLYVHEVDSRSRQPESSEVRTYDFASTYPTYE